MYTFLNIFPWYMITFKIFSRQWCRNSCSLKVHLHEIFWYKVVWPKEPIWVPDNPIIFLILALNLKSIWLFMHSRFALHILNIWTDSFHIFSNYAQENSVWRFTSFRVFSVYLQIHSSYMNRFILRILRICTDSFHVFGDCAQKFLNIQKESLSSSIQEKVTSKIIYMCAIGPKTHRE
jgi:hypothetical protein